MSEYTELMKEFFKEQEEQECYRYKKDLFVDLDSEQDKLDNKMNKAIEQEEELIEKARRKQEIINRYSNQIEKITIKINRERYDINSAYGLALLYKNQIEKLEEEVKYEEDDQEKYGKLKDIRGLKQGFYGRELARFTFMKNELKWGE